MDDLILFRFHKDIDHCVENLDILQTLNPDTPIYGVGEKIDGYKKLTNSYLEDIHVVTNKTDRWKWLNGDFVIVDWFENVGHKLDFDRCYVVEWDMIYTEPMASVYSHIDKDQIGITGYHLPDNYGWMNGRTDEILYIKNIVESHYDSKNEDVSFGVLPGLVLPYGFIQKYAEVDIPTVANDEMRLSIVATYSDYTIEDTNLQEKINDPYFNAQSNTTSVNNINAINNCNKSVFHPIRNNITDFKDAID